MSELIQQIEAAGLGRAASPTKGEVIYHQGNQAEHLVVVRRGIVYLTISNPLGRGTVTEIIKGGDWFGYEVFEGLDYYQSSATALTETEISRIESFSINKVFESWPNLKDEVERSMARSHRLVTQRMADLHTKSTQQLLADFILDMADSEGAVEALSHQVIGSLINRAREEINRKLYELKTMGVIDFEERRRRPISILDRDRLETIAQRAHLQNPGTQNQ